MKELSDAANEWLRDEISEDELNEFRSIQLENRIKNYMPNINWYHEAMKELEQYGKIYSQTILDKINGVKK